MFLVFYVRAWNPFISLKVNTMKNYFDYKALPVASLICTAPKRSSMWNLKMLMLGFGTYSRLACWVPNSDAAYNSTVARPDHVKEIHNFNKTIFVKSFSYLWHRWLEKLRAAIAEAWLRLYFLVNRGVSGIVWHVATSGDNHVAC